MDANQKCNISVSNLTSRTQTTLQGRMLPANIHLEKAASRVDIYDVRKANLLN